VSTALPFVAKRKDLLSYLPSGVRGPAMAALGIVFGDIGTSPLYAFRTCFTGTSAITPSASNVLGLLSLIFWSLILVISVKYVAIMLKWDNRGEGGVLALSTLLGGVTRNWKLWTPIAMMGVLGAALFFGDGFLTPAISVLSAVEGLTVLAPDLQRFVIPVTVAILLLLFIAQKYGTGTVGRIFGPIVLVWFVTLATLGAVQIATRPEILQALNPYYAVRFFAENGAHGFVALSAVFLAVTGGEALYADMGHFGRLPIRNAWFQVVLPALVLNYFGQGALVMGNASAVENPFYLLAPSWLLPFMILLATAATIIASQAVISGVFSVTSQALHLGYLPQLRIQHSSETEMGQVYVPAMNGILLVGTISLVLLFKSSDALAGAYGIAVSSTMLMAGIMVDMLGYITQTKRRWPTLTVFFFITLIDAAFFSSNLLKFTDGGWLPVLLAIIIFTVMTTWHEGRRSLNWAIAKDQVGTREFLASLEKNPPKVLPGTAVFLASEASGIPRALTQSVRFYSALHERNILFTFVSTEVPRLEPEERIVVERVNTQIIRVISRQGFMQETNVIAALKAAEASGVEFRPTETVFVVGRDTASISSRRGMPMWRKRLFDFMSRNSSASYTYFGLPSHRTLEIGAQTEL
jgi:KUP system potassium uptake protein